jgi:hypothetical protein
VHSTPPINTPIEPTRRRYKILLTAMERIAWPMRSQRDAAKAQGTDFDEAAGCLLANDPDYLMRIAATALEEIIADDTAAPVVDPIYAAIEEHRAAYAAYDAAAEGPDDENDEAFRELDRASQHLMRAEASTLAGLIALLRYVAPLLQQAGARVSHRDPVRRTLECSLWDVLRQRCEQLGGDRDRGLCSHAGARRPCRQCDRRSDRTAHR